MAKPVFLQTFSTLSKKIDALIANQIKLQEKVKDLEVLNRELQLQHEEDQEALKKARKDIEFLTLSHRLAQSPEALVSARNKISELIRTIDSCIRMIRED